MTLVTQQCDSAAYEKDHIREENEANMSQTSVISTRILELNAVVDSAGETMRGVPTDGDCMFTATSVALEQLGLRYSLQQLRKITAVLRKDPLVDGTAVIHAKLH